MSRQIGKKIFREVRAVILERIMQSASPRLAGKKIREVRVGLNLLVVDLDDGSLGVTYVLKDDIGHICSAVPQAGGLSGKAAGDIAEWAVTGKNVITVAIGLAVLNSVAAFDNLNQADNTPEADAAFSVAVTPEDTVGVIGHIGPVIAAMTGKAKRVMVFERGQKAAGDIYPEESQAELLPQCQVVFVSGTSLINGTLETLLPHCTAARDIVLVGSSTPLYPDAFTGSGVTVLAGTKWPQANRDAVLAGISQCAGMQQLIRLGQKITVRVPARQAP